jgi:gliding motility-associated-like protein
MRGCRESNFETASLNNKKKFHMTRTIYIILFLISQALFIQKMTGQTPNLPLACAGGMARYGVSGTFSDSQFDWEVTGGTILQKYNDSIDIQWDQVAGIKVVKATEHAANMCESAPSYGYVMVSVPDPQLTHQTAICAGQIAELSPANSYVTYLWSTGAQTKAINATTAGWYYLQVTDDNGCAATDSAYLTVNLLPVVNLGRDTSLCGSLVLDAGSGWLSYQWSTNANSQTIEVQPGKQQISVEVLSEQGCAGRDTINILSCRGDRTSYKIPNTFTPNGDGDNDTWRISYLESYPNASVEIFDRWGRLVFQSKQGFPSSGWDGTSRGKDLPMDSYYYIIKLGDGSDPITGNVTIVR